MTKKRRHLRILASIIAAGCVWATGMGNAWAADPVGAAGVAVHPWNYIGIGDAEMGIMPDDFDAGSFEWVDGSDNAFEYTIIENGETTKLKYKYFTETYNLLDRNGNPIYQFNNDGKTLYYIKDSSTTGYRYLTQDDVYETIWNEKFGTDNANGSLNNISSPPPLPSENHAAAQQTDNYWIRDGFGVDTKLERYHNSATMLKVDLFSYQNQGSYDYVVKSGSHAVEVTDTDTAVIRSNLNKYSYGIYAALTNSASTAVSMGSQFFVYRDDFGDYTDVGSTTERTKKNFYIFKDGEFNNNTGKYTFKGVDVEYEDVYTISEGNQQHVGVFLTKTLGDEYDFSTTKSFENNQVNSLFAGIEVYKGSVYGYHNEILISGYDSTSGKYLTAWGAEITDPSATIETMTIQEFNNFMHHLHDEDVKLAEADFEYAHLGGNSTAGATISMLNQKGYDAWLAADRIDATIAGDAVISSFSLKSNAAANQNTQLVISTPDKQDGIALDMGSRVIGTTTTSTSGNKYLDTLSINETVYHIDEIESHILSFGESRQGEGKDLLVSTITTKSGNTFSSSIRIGEFLIAYDGTDGNGTPGTPGTPGQSGTSGSGGDTTIEQAINKNYELINQGWNASVDDEDANGNSYPLPNIQMGETLAFESDTNIVLSTTVKDELVQSSKDSIKIALNPDLTGLTSITLVDEQSNKVEINPTTINMNGGDITNVDNITTKVITLGDNNNTTEINYQTNYEHGDRITYQEGNTTQYVANLNDGLNFGADDGRVITKKLNEQLNINGDNNINTAVGNQGNLLVNLNRDLNDIDSIQVNNSITVGNIKINEGGKITNVAEGDINENSTDVVVGSQLYQVQQQIDAGNAQLSNRLDRLGNRVDKVGAGAAALAALHPMDFDPDDKLQFSAGVGNYRGETAAALGAFYRPTEKVMFSVAGTMGNDDNMVSAGVTFALDRKNNVSNSRVAMAHEIQDLREQVAALTALVSQIAGKGNPLLDTVMFPDVPENHWAYDYVEGLQKRGIIEGYPDGNYGGDRSMTRYEYAAMLYRALEKGFPVDGRLLKEFEAELGRIRIDRIKGADDDANKVERVRVNDYEDRDDYGSKLAKVVADAAPVVEEEPAA